MKGEKVRAVKRMEVSPHSMMGSRRKVWECGVCSGRWMASLASPARSSTFPGLLGLPAGSWS